MAMLFVITNSILCRGNFLTRIEQIASAKPDRIILREKHLSQTELLALALNCKKICDKYGVEFSVNSSIETALAVGSDVHLPYQIFIENIDSLVAFNTIGVSVHSVSEAENAERLGASYLVAGHIFATDCKKGLAPRGLDYLSEIAKAVKIPVFGIGGITKERIPEVLQTGASGVCVMSHLMTCDKPELEIEKFKI